MPRPGFAEGLTNILMGYLLGFDVVKLYMLFDAFLIDELDFPAAEMLLGLWEIRIHDGRTTGLAEREHIALWTILALKGIELEFSQILCVLIDIFIVLHIADDERRVSDEIPALVAISQRIDHEGILGAIGASHVTLGQVLHSEAVSGGHATELQLAFDEPDRADVAFGIALHIGIAVLDISKIDGRPEIGG